MITISSRKDGFRRCGMAHPAAATSYPDDKFSKEQLDALRAEPMLTVIVTKDDTGGQEKKAKTDAEAKAKAEAEAKAKADADAKAKAEADSKSKGK